MLHGQNLEWLRQFGSNSHDWASAVAAHASGTYVAGLTGGVLPGQTSGQHRDAFVRKYDAAGFEVWTRQFGTSALDEALAAAADSTGVYVAGWTTGTFPGQTRVGTGENAFVRKYDPYGNELWTQQFGVSGLLRITAATLDASGLYVAGSTDGDLSNPEASASGSWTFVRKFGPSGNTLWTHQFGSPSFAVEILAASADATGLYVTGSTGVNLATGAPVPALEYFVLKYNPDGSVAWTRQSANAGEYVTIAAAGAAGFYIAGQTGAALPGQTYLGFWDTFVRKCDPLGAEIWTRQFGTTSDDIPLALAADAAGVFVAGVTTGALPGQTSAGGADAFVRHFDAAGNAVWTRQWGTTVEDRAMAAASATGLYVAGHTLGTLSAPSSGAIDAFIAKFSQPSAGTTPIGPGVSVTPVDATTGQPSPANLSFSNVTQGGETTVATTSSGPPPPTGFRIGGNTYIDIQTSAQFSGPVTLAFNYSAYSVNENNLRLFHLAGFGKLLKDGTTCNHNNGCWEDVTDPLTPSGGPNPNTAADIIYGTVRSLSPFVLAEVLAISAPSAPVQVETVVQASISAAGTGYSTVWSWGDGISTVETGLNGTHAYSSPGIYSVGVSLRRNGIEVGSARFEYVVVYDPAGGFVTGGGWIVSPPGAYAPQPALTGKATFGFVSKYLKGATTPKGDTQFQFSVAGLSFKSTAYEWLVVAGARAQFKGSGSINGAGSFGFLLTAVDGQVAGGGGQDRFRIKIWDQASGQVLYDNQAGANDDAHPSTGLGGGSIMVHKP